MYYCLFTDYMDSLCKDHFLQRQYRKLDGGVLWSRNERNLDCTVTFQTHSILQRFMLHFDLLQLDCNDHLYVYDGAHATAPPKVRFFYILACQLIQLRRFLHAVAKAKETQCLSFKTFLTFCIILETLCVELW